MNFSAKPRVILGLLTFGPPGFENQGARIISLQEYQECLDYFQQNGYCEVDTARTCVGGLQEAFTRSAGWKERDLTLATKCYPTSPGMHGRDQIKKILMQSLEELGCDCVDIFYLHAPDRSVPFEETLEACNDLFKEKKFSRLGLSNYAAWEVAEIWNIANERGWVKPTVYQAMYNVFTCAIEDELIPCCRKYGLDVILYNPLAGGLLSGKYVAEKIPDTGRYSDVDSKIGAMYRERYFKHSTFDALKMVKMVVAKYKLTLIETALRWCIHHSKLNVISGADGIIIGISILSQLESNLRDLERALCHRRWFRPWIVCGIMY